MVVLAMLVLPQQAAATETAVRVSITSSAPIAPAMRYTPLRSQQKNPSEVAGSPNRAYFGHALASSDARHTADWIVDSADNKDRPFMVVDKKNTRVYLFDAGGRIQGEAPALLGMARGDHTVPGIGDREYADMPPEARTTPAGRFIAEMGVNARGEDIVWVDYDAAVSLHRVVTSNAKERRLQRLATPTPLDNRISYGCINVPVQFYEKVVRPAFTGRGGIVYVLPEIRTLRDVFASYDVEERSRTALQTQQNAGIVTASITGQ